MYNLHIKFVRHADYFGHAEKDMMTDNAIEISACIIGTAAFLLVVGLFIARGMKNPCKQCTLK